MTITEKMHIAGQIMQVARDTHWRLWHGTEEEKLLKLQKAVDLITQGWGCEPLSLSLDPMSETSAARYDRSGKRGIMRKPSVTSTLFLLFLHEAACRREPVVPPNIFARSLSVFFQVWPNKKDRPDIFGKEFLAFPLEMPEGFRRMLGGDGPTA